MTGPTPNDPRQMTRAQLITEVEAYRDTVERMLARSQTARRMARAAKACCRPLALPNAEEREQLRAALREWTSGGWR